MIDYHTPKRKAWLNQLAAQTPMLEKRQTTSAILLSALNRRGIPAKHARIQNMRWQVSIDGVRWINSSDALKFEVIGERA